MQSLFVKWNIWMQPIFSLLFRLIDSQSGPDPDLGMIFLVVTIYNKGANIYEELLDEHKFR